MIENVVIWCVTGGDQGCTLLSLGALPGSSCATAGQTASLLSVQSAGKGIA